MHCKLCENITQYEIKSSGFENDNRLYEVHICSECGMGITYPQPSRSQIDRLYSAEKYRDHQSRFILPIEKLVRFFRKARKKQIEYFIKNGRILDLGCGRGIFLLTMKAGGWETHGLELNEETAQYAREGLVLDIKTVSLREAKFADNYFDVIVIWHVLEHLSDPIETIEECRRILKSGGLLVVAIPNFESFQAKISGSHWFHLDIPYHLYHFTLKNLKLVLEKNSFKIVKTRHFSFEFNPFGCLQSFLNMCHIEHNLLYNVLKSRSLRKSAFPKTGSLKLFSGLVITVLISTFMVPLSLIFSVIESLFKRGGTLETYAIKAELK